MSQTVRIEISGVNGLTVREVTFKEAKDIVKQAYAKGSLVIDKSTSQVIRELNSNIKELWITHIIAGG